MEFDDPIVGTTSLIREAIQSPNYVAGIAGWIIRKDGTAEFQDLIARGSITADRVAVPFINQNGNEYTIDIGEANVDQPGIEFQFEGDNFDWTDGVIDVEAFDNIGRGSMRLRPMQPSGATGAPFLGSAPNIWIESHRKTENALAAGRIEFTSSRRTGMLADIIDYPVFRVSSVFGVNIEHLRTWTANLENDATREVINDTSFGADFACNITMRRPASGILTVELWSQMRTTAGTGGGMMGFEVRDTNAGGTIRLSSSDARAVYSTPAVTGFHSTGGSFTDAIAGTSEDIFIRLMFRTSTATTTANFARCRLAAKGSA